MIPILIVGGIVVVVVALLFFIGSALYTVARQDEVHVLVQGKGTTMVTGDPNLQQRLGIQKSAYFHIPEWFFPLGLGMKVTRIPLEMLEFSLENFQSWDEHRVRFKCDVSANLIVDDPEKASIRFPKTTGNRIDWDSLKSQIGNVLKESVRGTTTKSNIHKIINDIDAVSNEIEKTMGLRVGKWGLKLDVFNLTDIADVSGQKDSQGNVLTPVQDISSIRETEISSEARQKNAQQIKEAEVIEAQSKEAAEVREQQYLEKVQVRTQQKEQATKVAEQKKEQAEALARKDTEQKKVDADRAMTVGKANYDKEQKVIAAEAEAEANELKGKGEGQQLKLKGEGEAAALYANKEAEAKGLLKLAEAQQKQQEKAKEIRAIEAQEFIGEQYAKALTAAEIKIFSGSGEGAKGIDLAQFVSSVAVDNKGLANSILNRIARPNEAVKVNLGALPAGQQPKTKKPKPAASTEIPEEKENTEKRGEPQK